jgi:hypothetical protein
MLNYRRNRRRFKSSEIRVRGCPSNSSHHAQFDHRISANLLPRPFGSLDVARKFGIDEPIELQLFDFRCMNLGRGVLRDIQMVCLTNR